MILLSKKFLFIYFIAYSCSSMLTANLCRITTITKENGQIIYLLSDWKEEPTETHQPQFTEFIEHLKALEDSSQRGLHILTAAASKPFFNTPSLKSTALASLVEHAQKLNLKKSTIENITIKSCTNAFNVIASCYPDIESINLASPVVNARAQEVFGHRFDKLSFQDIVDELVQHLNALKDCKNTCNNLLLKAELKSRLAMCDKYIDLFKWILEEEIKIGLDQSFTELLPALTDELNQARFMYVFKLVSKISIVLSSLYILSRIHNLKDVVKFIIIAESDCLEEITTLLATTSSTLKTKSVGIQRELFNETLLNFFV